MKIIMFVIWLIDILNIDFIIANISIKELLDITIPLNFWFWLIFWILIPTNVVIEKE